MASPSRGGQTHDKAGARDGRCPVRVKRTRAVLHPNGAAMGLDDLFRDGQSQAGILAKSLVRPVGVETLENFIERIGPHARPVIIDDNLDDVLEAAAGYAHRTSGR